MPNLWVVFLTGLTTGGLSCLAVQGGLLANVIANQAGDELSDKKGEDQPDVHQLSKKQLLDYYQSHSMPIKAHRTFRKDVTLSILLFLIAKVTAYTLLGLMLGWLGTMLQLNPITRGILMLGIAVFMVGTALRLLNIHPIFNLFQIQPPKFVRKFIRKLSKNSKEDFATPIFLGSLTILIPCGITQAMMVLALGTGKPIAGALIILVFTLGTSPLFFGLAYFTARIGETLNQYFLKVVAVLVLVFAFYSLESGLNLVGSPYSYASIKQRHLAALEEARSTYSPTTIDETPAPTAPSESKPSEQTLSIGVQNNGYSPALVKAASDVPTKITFITNSTTSCARAIVFPSLNLQKVLPETGTETITIPAQKKGTLRYTCSMGMYNGQITFN